MATTKKTVAKKATKTAKKTVAKKTVKASAKKTVAKKTVKAKKTIVPTANVAGNNTQLAV